MLISTRRNVVKAFYSSGVLYDILQTFGELSEEALHNRKYAKWKAAYIHNCLKNGETPIPGPLPDDDETELEGEDNANASADTSPEDAAGAAAPPPSSRHQRLHLRRLRLLRLPPPRRC